MFITVEIEDVRRTNQVEVLWLCVTTTATGVPILLNDFQTIMVLVCSSVVITCIFRRRRPFTAMQGHLAS
jgi:hypothetical protein